MSEKLVGKCNKDGCTVAEDGKCLNGCSELKECPNYIMISEPVDTEAELNDKTPTEVHAISDMIELPSGTGLSFDSATKITKASITRVIVLAGAAESGKTTLLASLYENFQKSSFAGYMFAGSQTIIEFENLCHLARISSNMTISDTERTKPGFEKLFHLNVRIEDCGEPSQDLLFADISGETYNMVRDYTEECRKLQILKRADHLVLLIDGEKIADNRNRQEAFIDADLLLRSCLDAEMIGKRSFVEVLFSKYDLIEENDDNEQINKFLNYIETTFRKRYEDKLGQLRFYSIAARPKHGSQVPFSFGLNKVFPSWIKETPFTEPFQDTTSTELFSQREFDRYCLKDI